MKTRGGGLSNDTGVFKEAAHRGGHFINAREGRSLRIVEVFMSVDERVLGAGPTVALASEV